MEEELFINLTKSHTEWVALLIKDGKYSNCDDYIKDLINRDILKNEKLLNMFKAIEKRIDDGEVK